MVSKLAHVLTAAILAAGLLSPTHTVAQDESFPILFTNVHVFDGVNEDRIENASVLVEGNLIKTVSTEAIEARVRRS